jgi:hypothetical protein
LIFRYFLDQNPENVEELREDLVKRIEWKRNPLDPRCEQDYLFSLVDTERLEFWLLKSEESNKTQGIITYEPNRIHLLYLRNEVENSKIAAFRLVDKAVSEMRKKNSDFIFSTLDRWSNVIGYEHLSNALGLLDFVQGAYIELYLDVGSDKNNKYEKPVVVEKGFSIRSFNPDEHRTNVLDLSAEFPDPFTKTLFPETSGDFMELRRRFLDALLFGGEKQKKWSEIDPVASSIVLGSSGKCLGYLIFNKSRLRIMGMMVHPDFRKMKILSGMLWRMKDKLRDQSLDNIYVSIHAGRRKCLKILEKAGFATVTDFSMWGWRRDDRDKQG